MSIFSPNVRKLTYNIRINFELLGIGRHREVYLLPSKKFVIKIPINNDGILDNLTEYKYWKNRAAIKKYYDADLARCRLYQGSTSQDKLLLMEFIEIIKNPRDLPYNTLPNWAWDVDGIQVGYNRQRHIVAYDYGSQLW